MLVEFGKTRVLCAASVTEEVPRWRRGSGLGWVTAEYAMLPRATNTRNDRESVKGRLGGRTHEISRLVGRSLRAAVDYKALGENTIVIDCDVLQADGGTRTAAVTGGYVALADAIDWLRKRGKLKGSPLVASVAAVSVGIVDGEPRLDLCYEEDSAAETDMNVVCTGTGDFVEIQGTAEREPFSRAMLGSLLDLGTAGCAELTRLQTEALAATRSARARSVADAARRVVLATRNAGKIAELNRILADVGGGVEIVGLEAFPDAPDVPETGLTFADNALLKARAIAACTGLPAVSDDSGLAADALHGMPGVLSARWAGRHGDDAANLELLLGQLADVGRARRRVRLRAALALPGGRGVDRDGRAGRDPHPRPARRQRLRLRPDLRPRGPVRHHGRARAGGEGRDQPPRPRLPRHRPAHRRPRLAAGARHGGRHPETSPP